MLLDLSFQLGDYRQVLSEYQEQAGEIFEKIMLDGFNKSDPTNPGHTLVILPEDLTWMLVRDADCLGNAEVDMSSNPSIHIRFDQLEFKLAAVWYSALWKSDSLVRIHRPTMVRHNETVERSERKPRLRLIEEDAGKFMCRE